MMKRILIILLSMMLGITNPIAIPINPPPVGYADETLLFSPAALKLSNAEGQSLSSTRPASV